MDTKPAALWFPSILILGIPTLVTIMVRVQTGSDLFMLIPWVTAPIIGFGLRGFGISVGDFPPLLRPMLPLLFW